MQLFKFILVFVATCLASCADSAQTVGIGTTKGGATGQVSAGIAKVVSSHGDLQARTQPMAGTKQYILPRQCRPA